ncbi:MAG TPA: hypothetical protein VEA36_00395 [Candidatus Paceibacterota bacterium]|nr:hypothetical protein [Candidatus Paceibacterota bacterium]
MSRESLLMVLGILIVVSPFTGLPLSLLTWFYVAAGLLIAAIGFTLRLRRRRRAITHEAPPSALS